MTTLEAPPRIALTIHQVKDLNLSSFSTQNDCKSCTCNVHCRLLLQHEDQSRTLSSSITKSRFFGEALSGHLDLYRSSVDENNWDVLKDSNIFQIEFGNQQDNNQNSLALNISLSLNKDGDLRDQSSIGEAQIPINQNELLNGDMKEWIDLMSQGGELVGRICVSIQTKKFLQKENNQLDPIYDALYNANSSPSPKEDSFYISIALKDVHNIPTQYAENSFWISYEFLDAIIQTVQFNSSTSSSSSFEPKEDVFQFSIKRSELPSFLQCNKIKIYICKEGGIIGSAEVDLFYAFCREDQNELVLNGEERYVEGLIELHSENGDNLSVAKTQLRMNVVPNSDYPQLFMSLSLSHGMLRTNQSEQDSLNSCSTINDTFQKEVAQHTFSRGLGPSADNKLVDLNYQTEDLLLQRAKSIATAEIELDKKQKQWEEFRHREEIKFREHLRKKEEVVRRHLDEQIKRKESQQMGVIKRCRSEYKELESRLKIALSEVETKEREMRRILAANNTTFIQKITELDLKEKLIREEAQHVVDMEVCMFIFHFLFLSKQCITNLGQIFYQPKHTRELNLKPQESK
jgi:hypothetical protein